MGAGMDDLDNDIKRTIDDAVDETELLPFRYTKYRKTVWYLCNTYAKKLRRAQQKGTKCQYYS